MPKNVFGQEIGVPIDDWAPRALPPHAARHGRFVRIEPIDADRHAADLFAAFAKAPDARDWTYLPVDRFDDPAAYKTFVASQAMSEDPRHNAIVEIATGRAVGTAALMRIDPANGVIEVGHIVFSPRLQRSPAGTEALYLLMTLIFDDLGYRRLEWKCDRLNVPSCRAAERYGFTFEGVFRQAIVTKGRNRDTAWYAMTDGDWPARRAAFRCWLDPNNFEADGRQIRRLEDVRRAL